MKRRISTKASFPQKVEIPGKVLKARKPREGYLEIPRSTPSVPKGAGEHSGVFQNSRPNSLKHVEAQKPLEGI